MKKLLLYIALIVGLCAPLVFAGPVSWLDGVSAVNVDNLPAITIANGINTTGADGTFVGDVCGTTPTITGSDMAGKITVGSTTTTSCAFTFAAAYSNAPACVVAGNNSAVTYAATTTTTIMTFVSSADMAGDVVSYICIGLP